jgi:hypothetical protein
MQSFLSFSQSHTSGFIDSSSCPSATSRLEKKMLRSSLALLGKFSRSSHPVNLSPKHAHKGYYKGNAGDATGIVNRRGGSTIRKDDRLQIVVPEGLESTQLRPYVAHK